MREAITSALRHGSVLLTLSRAGTCATTGKRATVDDAAEFGLSAQRVLGPVAGGLK
jgi:hypothetical protein